MPISDQHDRALLLSIDHILDETIRLIQEQNADLPLRLDRPRLRWLVLDFYDRQRKASRP